MTKKCRQSGSPLPFQLSEAENREFVLIINLVGSTLSAAPVDEIPAESPFLFDPGQSRLKVFPLFGCLSVFFVCFSCKPCRQTRFRIVRTTISGGVQSVNG
ncbi:hypothetical protein B0H19DRAFT_648908 [Mycena capillaripes]|nr:hypothetical protein B0H19DRAFT_648908 [Mycena capillaripes]